MGLDIDRCITVRCIHELIVDETLTWASNLKVVGFDDGLRSREGKREREGERHGIGKIKLYMHWLIGSNTENSTDLQPLRHGISNRR